MTGPTYPAARAVSGLVRSYFENCVEAARARGEQPAPAPDAQAIEEMTSAGFWASLRREEGRSPKISLAYLPPALAGEAVTFGQRLPLDPGVLAKVAPAVERPGIHLGVWRIEGRLWVWGATHTLPPSCLVLEVVQPGLLVVKRRRQMEDDKYANIAVLQGDEVKIVKERADLPGGVPAISAALGFDSSRTWTDRLNVVVQLAMSMRTHGHGGLLLIVPHGTEEWLQSVVHPIPYRAVPPFAELWRLLQMDPLERDEPAWHDAFRKAVETVGGATAVDGATVIDDRYQLLAFGVKIRRSPAGSPLQRVMVVEPIEGSTPLVVDPSALGGTRHLSAAQFVCDQPHALALVASQDGHFTVFSWPPGEEIVRAHAIESLLL